MSANEEEDLELRMLKMRKLRELMSEGRKEEPQIHQPTPEEFDKLIATSDKPVLVDFWAEWCMPCHMMHPIFEKLAKKYGDRVVFVRINVDLAPSIAGRYGIMAIPTFMMFIDGAPADMVVGAVGEGPLEAMIRKYVGG